MKKLNYVVTISLKNASRLNFTAQAPYYGAGGIDHVSFAPNTITIEGERGCRYTETDIFCNVQNSLYNQMLKCLQIHYCFEGSRAGITRIAIIVESEVVAIREYTDAFQPCPAFDAPIPFEEVALRQLLLEDNDSYALRIIISHWLSQGETTICQRRMESVWRTFEHICDHLRHAAPGKRSNIAEGLDLMVQELTNHPATYPHAAALISGETKTSLRQFRWHDMIENNYPETLHAGSSLLYNYQKYKFRLCDPYVDERVCALMKDLLPYRRRELQNYGLYHVIEADLNNKIALHQTKDIDVVALLCHYAYYLRNRLFHGQTLIRGSIFEPVKSDEMRIEMLSTMLSILTVELINNYRVL